MDNNVSFSGKFIISKNQLNNLSLGKKMQLIKHQSKLVDTFCQQSSDVAKKGSKFIIDVKSSQEKKFQKLMSKIGLVFEKISE